MNIPYTIFDELDGLIPDIPADSIVSRTVFNNEDMKLVLFGFAAGQELSEHTAAKPATLHFLSGTSRLTLGEDEMTVHPGAWVHMPAHLPHSVVAETDVKMALILLKGAG